ncbi:MAG: hypothetical protein IPM98_13255 [Lewinellaceae bacterium]|nr:hypothetical protein [Lewinellaceae bacterium]
MMKNWFLLFGTLFLAGPLLAQTDNFPAVVVSTAGKVRYASADNSLNLKIAPGAVVKNDGTLKISGNGSAVVYCNGRLKSIKGKGNHALSDIFKPGGLSSLNFDPEFGKYIRASVEFVATKQVGDGMGQAITNPKQGGDGWGSAITNPKQGGDGWGAAITNPKQGGDGWGAAITNPKQGGDGWGTAITNPKQGGDGMGAAITNPKQGGDGWGGSGITIIPILPFGKLLPGNTDFIWSRPTGAKTYQLNILDENNKSLHSITTTDTFATIDLRTLNLPPNQLYSWNVQVPGNPGMTSATRDFVLSTSEEQATASARASNSTLYRDGTPVVRGLMEAVALEKGEWLAAAEQRYATLLQKHPKDNMLRVMYAAFWMRYGLEPKAKSVLK